jgi:hypothetical protein
VGIAHGAHNVPCPDLPTCHPGPGAASSTQGWVGTCRSVVTAICGRVCLGSTQHASKSGPIGACCTGPMHCNRILGITRLGQAAASSVCGWTDGVFPRVYL